MKTVLIIAGSDPGAGAGLQQDLKVTTLLGAYGLTVVTALTVQNSQGVTAVHPVAPEVVAAQLDAVLSDFPVAAVKVGMLATPALVRTVAERLKALDGIPLVLDPVLAAGGGFPLLTADGIARLTEELFPLTHLLTPNAPEAARLAGIEVQTPEDLAEAARRLQAMGPRWVLAKGGHLPGEPVDVLTDGNNVYHLPGVRLAAPNHHGSGCLLASAAAAGLAQGASVPEAVNRARDLTAQALKYGLPLGRGAGPVNPYAPFARELARPEVLDRLADGRGPPGERRHRAPHPGSHVQPGVRHPLPGGAPGRGRLPRPAPLRPPGPADSGPAGLRRLPPHQCGHPHRHGHPPGAQERHERQILRRRR